MGINLNVFRSGRKDQSRGTNSIDFENEFEFDEKSSGFFVTMGCIENDNRKLFQDYQNHSGSNAKRIRKGGSKKDFTADAKPLSTDETMSSRNVGEDRSVGNGLQRTFSNRLHRALRVRRTEAADHRHRSVKTFRSRAKPVFRGPCARGKLPITLLRLGPGRNAAAMSSRHFLSRRF